MSDLKKHNNFHGRLKARLLSDKQKDLLQTLYPKVQLLSQTKQIPINEKFILEIGFGGGENIAHQAKLNPETTYVGCEPFINGVVSLLQKIEANNLNNIFIWQEDAVLLLEQLQPQSIKEVFILFPDPWPKKRHHKRRFINIKNLLLIHDKLTDDAILNIATDHQDYLEWILDVVNKNEFKSRFKTLHDENMSRPDYSIIPQTRFEAKGLKANHLISFLKFAKVTPQ
jgi:tRNA (guanine-N7-)-methyltransferase